MSDWIGLAFLAVLLAGAIIGLRVLSKPQTRTSEEFERNAAEGTTMLGASMNALNELMNPSEAKAKRWVTQLRPGRFETKKREAKGGGNADPHAVIEGARGAAGRRGADGRLAF